MRSSLPIAAVLAVLAVPAAAAGADDQATTSTSPVGASGAAGTAGAGSTSGSSAALRAAAARSRAATTRSASRSTTTSSATGSSKTVVGDGTAGGDGIGDGLAGRAATDAAGSTGAAGATGTTGATGATGSSGADGSSGPTDDDLTHPEDPDVRAQDTADAKAKRAAAKKAKAKRTAAAKKAATRKAAAERATRAKAAKDAAASTDAVDGDLSADALLAAPDTALSKASLATFRIPLFLLPIYQAAGAQYGVRWEVLAAINEIETDYGRNLNVSTAGAQGWMQFMPATWKTYGTDATGDGKADPYNPADAIFAAARYLKAAGAGDDVAKAIFAYNHADWYVQDVLKRAKAIAALPTDVVGSLTGLSSAQLPVYADDVTVRKGGDEDWAPIDAKAGSPVVAVQDGTVTRSGTSKARGRWIEIRDAYGNRYTYAHLGDLAEQHLVAKDDQEGGDAKRDGATRGGDGAKADGGSTSKGGQGTTGAVGPAGATGSTDPTGETGTTSPSATGSAPAADDLTIPGGGTSTTADPAPTEAATAGRQREDRVRSKTSRRAGSGGKGAATGTGTTTGASGATTGANGTTGLRTVAPGGGAPTTPATPGAGGAPATPATPGTSTTPSTVAPGAPVNGLIPAVPPNTATASSTGGTWMWSQDSLNRALAPPQPTQDASPSADWALAPLDDAGTGTDERPTGDLDRYQVRSPGLRRSDLRLTSLHTGSRVTAGTVLGRTGEDPMRFAVRPAGSGAPQIDPRPVLEGWERLQETTATGADAKEAGRLQTAVDAASASDADAGSLLLLNKAQLQQRVLANPRLSIYAAGREDIRTGQIDRRVLATMEYLTADGTKLAISSLRSGHSTLSSSGNVSAHSYGCAMDIASVNGTPITGHQGTGSITETTIRRLLRLQGAAAPNQIISLMTIAGAPSTMAMADHADHIHVGFPRASGSGGSTLGDQVAATLQPSQWPELVDRLAQIDNPDVRSRVSKAATKADDGD